MEYYQRHHGPVPVVRLWLDGDLITAKCHDRPDALRDIAAALTEAAGLLDIINEQEGNS